MEYKYEELFVWRVYSRTEKESPYNMQKIKVNRTFHFEVNKNGLWR